MIWQYLLLFFFVCPTRAQVQPPLPAGPELPPQLVRQPMKWPTLNGDEPIVVARGGYSGLFPDSSELAIQFALDIGGPKVVLYCDLQMTKDELGICQPSLRLENTTDAKMLFPGAEKTYDVYGQELNGWFSLDYDAANLIDNVSLIQNIYTRPNIYDGVFGLNTPHDVRQNAPANSFWLNVEYDMFYNQHKVSPARYIQKSAKDWTPGYISSPEVAFLKAMVRKMDKKQTKLIFKFKDLDMVEPTTKETYRAILEKLQMVKTFAAGILVPKQYIWPVNPSNFLMPKTTLVEDAHKLGLEVFAYNFYNDALVSYNYSFDPIKEYIDFIGKDNFAVDGVLTDFPSTASTSIECFAHRDLSKKYHPAVVMSHNGASGDYPGNTDLAYQKAIDDGTDVIDCPVQMSKDGVPFCLGHADLKLGANAFRGFADRSRTVLEIQPEQGIFTFDLTWSEIQTLKPVMKPSADNSMPRNPLHKHKGKFMTLQDFLELAGKKEDLGVVIVLQFAPYYAANVGFSVIDITRDALNNSTFNKQTKRRVMIMSDDSTVLDGFKDTPSYERLLGIKDISSVPKDLTEKLKKYADAVFISKTAIAVQDTGYFILHFSNISEQLRAADIHVYAGILLNEYTYLAFDYGADPYVELASLMPYVDGVMSDFPATAISYLRSPCSEVTDPIKNRMMHPFLPGMLVQFGQPQLLPPAGPPLPPLSEKDVEDPPMPPLKKEGDSTTTGPHAAAPQPKASNSDKFAANVAANFIISIFLLSYLTTPH